MANEDKKNAALRRIDEAPVRARQTWRHNARGGVYHVIAVGIDEPTLEPVVIYVGHDGVVWTRPLDVFLGEKDGQPRFTQIDDDNRPRERHATRGMVCSELEDVFEPECMTTEASSVCPDVPSCWFVVLDCEGAFICAVPPGAGVNPRDPAQTIARALNFAWEKAEDDVG